MMSSRRSLPVKRALRFVYTSLLFCLAWIINPKVRLKGLIAVRRDLKASDDLLLVAPGSSVRGLTQDDWDGFWNHDRLFVNYAALHESFRLGDLLSTEPHETIAEFVDGVAELDGPVLLKGFTSLSPCLPEDHPASPSGAEPGEQRACLPEVHLASPSGAESGDHDLRGRSMQAICGISRSSMIIERMRLFRQ